MREKQPINIGQITEYLKVPDGISKEDAWNRIEERISFENRKSSSTRSVIPLYSSIAIVAAGILYALFYFGFNLSTRYSPEKVTRFGEVENYWLPDSSLVEMNSNTSVCYNYNPITGHRNLELKGDALFNIKKGKEFIVAFYGGEVKVKGTSFYVSSYSPTLLQVDCIGGSVDVTLNNIIYTLQKGEGIKSFKGKISAPYPCNEDEVRKRLKGIFYWEKVSLAEIDELAEFRFGYDIILAPGLENRNFSGELDLINIQESMMIISMAMDVDYLIDEERKTISINAK